MLATLLASAACGAPEGELPGTSSSFGGAGTPSGQAGADSSSDGLGGSGSSSDPAGLGAGGSEQTAPLPLTGVSGSGGTRSSVNIPAVPIAPQPVVDGVPVCARYPVRSDGLILNFDSYDPVTGNWGDPSQGQLTGGTSGYSCQDNGGSCPDSAVIARVRTGSGGLRIQAAVPSQGYTGMVLWFGPCVDASPFGGIELLVGGELSGATMLIKLQTHINYPIDLVNTKGGCEYQSEATKWSECVPPEYQLSAVGADLTPLRLAWSDFGSGLPNPNVAPDGLVGVELQFTCPSDVDCAMDLRLGALQLTPNP